MDADSARVKALVASLGSVDIGEAMATAIAAPVATGAAPAYPGGASEAPADGPAEEEPEEDDGGFEGLGSLFG